MNRVSKWLWGGALVLLGVIMGVNALGVADIDIFFPGWWTLLIIIPCAIGLFGNDSDKWADLLGILLGVALLLGCQGVLQFSMIWKMALPTILVIVGLSILFKDVLKGKVVKEAKKLHNKGDGQEYWATFSEQNVNYAQKEFNGCRLEAVFGGVKCDVREAKIKDDVLIRASAVFGGVKIFVPENVEVQVVSSSMFGGVTNRRNNKSKGEEKKKTIYVEATCIFGGVEIK